MLGKSFGRWQSPFAVCCRSPENYMLMQIDQVVNTLDSCNKKAPGNQDYLCYFVAIGGCSTIPFSEHEWDASVSTFDVRYSLFGVQIPMNKKHRIMYIEVT
jgi:hypothetical protein